MQKMMQIYYKIDYFSLIECLKMIITIKKLLYDSMKLILMIKVINNTPTLKETNRKFCIIDHK